MLDYQLEKAIISGDIVEVKKLIEEQKCDYKAENNLAIRWAIEYGHLEIIKYFIDLGVNIYDKHIMAMELAVENNRLETVKYLLNIGVDIGDNLEIAIEEDYREIVKCILYNKPNFEILKSYTVDFDLNFDWLIESIYYDGKFEFVNDMIKHIGCNNDEIIKKLSKIIKNREDYNDKLKFEFYDIKIQ